MSPVDQHERVLDRRRLIGVHLNGSLNLSSAESVFRAAAELNGPWLKRLPDGETGPRLGWIQAMLPKFRAVEQLVELGPSSDRAYAEDSAERPAAPERSMPPVFGLRDGYRPEEIAFGDLGYAHAALESYALFQELRKQVIIPKHVRFQVSLPTPLAISRFAAHDDASAVASAVADRLRVEINDITSEIAHDELAIQWDVAFEFGLIEGVWEVAIPDPVSYCVTRLAELATLVPSDVHLGYHLCYGDRPPERSAEGQHFVEPRDTGHLVAVANGISAALDRSVNWISMPVPISRDDEDYFKPLSELRLHPETDLYLGLVHYQDGASGARRRIATAQRFASRFGIATECGMGRKTPERVLRTLEIQRELLEDRSA